MGGETFEGAIGEARRLEGKLVEYAPYDGAVRIERTLNLEPKEYLELSYGDLRNMYERTQKIISASGMGVFASAAGMPKAAEKAAPAAPKAETAEVESRLKEMTTETLKTAEEVAKEPIVLEKEAAAPAVAEAKEDKIEFEKGFKPPEPGLKVQPRPEIEFERETPRRPATPVEKAEAPKPEALSIRKEEAGPVPAAPIAPPVLRETPDEAAAKRFESIEEQIREALGEQADETALKKKMLELTKQLFKEKTTSKREEIKLHITVLKNMLSAGIRPKKAAAPAKGKRAKAEAEEGTTHVKVLDTLVSTHQSELSQSKDTIIDSYNKQIAAVKKRFYDDLAVTEDAAKRKEMFEAFVFAVESLVEQLPETIGKYREFTSKKHVAELEKLRDTLGPTEKETKGKVDERLAYVQGGYDKEFASVKGIVGRQIENMIELAGSEIFKRAEEKAGEGEEKSYEIVKEINETDEGTLLYFLHSKDPDFYKKYERKQLSKAEVIFKAKELMAEEKGLSEKMVRKYFSQTEA
ncbi:MAG: hypothetical protein AB1295_03050 [Candidatus Micrarchaeota archaeon]